MKIKLVKLIIKNFKGIKELYLDFGNLVTIQGENGTGKSTIFDAFTWGLFGKDSHDRSDFEIQTLDANNDVIHGLEHSVTLVLDVDGREKTFKRTLKERWVKPNGKAEKELKGCTTDYEIDEIPVKLKEYQAAINEMIDENLFKMVTNPLYFSNINWTKQREILLDIIGDISDENVINYDKKLEPLKKLLSNKDIDTFIKKVKSEIAKYKEKVKDIPARIDECNNNIKIIDFEELESKKKVIQNSINSLDEQIADSSKANEEKLKLQDELFKLKEQLSKLRNVAIKNANKPIQEIESKIYKVKSEIQELNFKIKTTERNRDNFCNTNLMQEKEIENLKAKRQNMLNEYHKAEDELFNFDDKETVCKCCGRAFDMDKIEEMKEVAKAKFEENKRHNLNAIKHSGLSLKENIEKAELLLAKDKAEVNELTDKVLELETQETELEKQLYDLEYQKQKIDCIEPVVEGEEELQSQINQIQTQIEQFKLNDNNTELKYKKKALQAELEEINITLGKKDVNEDLRKRMEELNQEEKDLQIKIAELEGQQFLGEEFIRTKVELLESSINKKFKGAVTFKLFENQVNGGLKETCEALVDGVPFGNANTASRINAGLSIINVLCDHYGVNAPVFIDNAESVNEIGYTESQLIKLVVSLNKELKVEVA